MNEQLIEFVKAWEGLKLAASGDPLVCGVRDIGYGHVLKPNEDLTSITESQADALLRADLNDVADRLRNIVAVPLDENRFDAMTSFAYNVGVNALAQSTLLRCVNACRYEGAALQFTLWCHAGGKEVQGLLARRFAEQALFVHGDYSGRP